MGNRRTAVKRFAAALTFLVAMPALGPSLRVEPLALDPLDFLTVTFGPGFDATDLLLELSSAGIPFSPDGLDSLDAMREALQGEGILDATHLAALTGSTHSNGSLSGAGGGTSGNSDGNHGGMTTAAGGDGSFSRGGRASPTSPTPLADASSGIDTADGRNSRYLGADREMPPFLQTGLPSGHTVGTPWHDSVIATGPGVIVKEGEKGDPLLNDPTNPGNGSVLGPFLTDSELPPSYPDDFPTDFTPNEFARLTVAINAVPEPGTLALLALGLAGLALARRKS